MSGNEPARKADARVARTRDRLGDALIQLLLEKPFETITVQDVLDRAGVGRSTFYTHFKDKDDLLLSDVDEFFRHVGMQIADSGEASDRLLPAREFFHHVAGARALLAAFERSGRDREVWALAHGHFARGIEQRLATLPRAAAIPAAERPARAHALAGSFLALVLWWTAAPRAETPEAMDALFHAMAWDGVSRAGDA